MIATMINLKGVRMGFGSTYIKLMKNKIIYTIILINSLPCFVAIDSKNLCVIEKIEYVYDYFNSKENHNKIINDLKKKHKLKCS